MSLFSCKLFKKLRTPHQTHELSVCIDLDKADFATLYGPSGVGKTTTLRMIAGLCKPDEGRIECNGVVWYDSIKRINLPPQQRNVGLVFQDYALFPAKTVLGNMTYAMDKRLDVHTVNSLIDQCGLRGMEKRAVTNLSGGEKQRVALARALAAKPSMLLLDEPLSALDMQSRRLFQDLLSSVHRKQCLPTIMVSHDIGEIYKLSSVVYSLKNGIIDKKGTPAEIFDGQSLLGMFHVSGEVVAIECHQIIAILSVVIGVDVVKIALPVQDCKALAIGDHIIVSAKEFSLSVKQPIHTIS